MENDKQMKWENESAFRQWEEEHPNDMPEDFAFVLRFGLLYRKFGGLSIPQLQAYILQRSLKWVEEQEFFDDYDDFVTEAKLEYDGDDLEMEDIFFYKITFKIELER